MDTSQVAIVAAFTGLVGLLSWLVKYLVTSVREGLDAMRIAVTEGVREMTTTRHELSSATVQNAQAIKALADTIQRLPICRFDDQTADSFKRAAQRINKGKGAEE